VRVKASLLAAPQTISRGTLNNANVVGPIPVTAPVSAITPGDATTANAMVQSFNNLVNFGSSGSIANVQTTLTGYSALFLSSNASMNATAEEDYINNKALSSEIESRFSGVSAVDIQNLIAPMALCRRFNRARLTCKRKFPAAKKPRIIRVFLTRPGGLCGLKATHRKSIAIKKLSARHLCACPQWKHR
jgi:hypothetical protein